MKRIYLKLLLVHHHVHHHVHLLVHLHPLVRIVLVPDPAPNRTLLADTHPKRIQDQDQIPSPDHQESITTIAKAKNSLILFEINSKSIMFQFIITI